MITIVISSYKYEHLLAQAVESVITQTRKADRIIVVDDASQRGSLNMFHHTGFFDVMRLYGKDVEYFRNIDNMGVVANFDNLLKNHVKTDKVMFLGADNWLRPDALEVLDRFNADIVSYDLYLVGNQAEKFAKTIQRGKAVRENGYLVWKFAPGNMDEDNHIHGSSLYNAEMAKQYGYKRSPDSARTAEDWELWKAMLNGGATHVHIKEPLLYYRRHDYNSNAIR